MPQRQNLKPAIADTLRTLRNDVQSGATVPHGVKTVQPGEGLQLVPPGDGAEIFWDWETANTWDTRITEGRAAIEQARADLDRAQADLTAGAARVEENRAILDALVPWVESAESTVAQASKDLTTLQGTVGDVSAAAKAAQKTAQDALFVGLGGNLIPNGDGRSPQGWEAFEWRTTGDTNGNPGAFGLKGTKYQVAAAAAAAAGDYQASVSVMGEHDGGKFYVQFEFADTQLARISAPYLVVSQLVANGKWATYTGPVTAPPGTAYVKTRIYPNHSSGVQANDYVWVTGVSLRPVVPGALIVNGSITGEKVDAGTVSGALAQFLQVEAASGTFTDSLTGRNARLLGETVAESINITGKLRGRDAILSGTVDVGQLNVTGAMSAKIISTATLQARQGFFTDGLTAQDASLLGTTVAEKLVVTDTFSARVAQSMTAETRKLIVTEDAILNRATVVEGLVTSELISKKANIEDLAARMVTSGKLQTSTAANRGVKIDNSGLRAWDDTGRQTVNLNGKNNVLTGTFQTAETRQRVRIAAGGTVAAADFYAGNDTDDHLGIWYNQTGTNILNAEANVLAMLGTSHTADSPGLKMWPGRGAFTLQGRWWPDSTAMKFALFMLSAGLGAGYYQRVTLNYPSPFPTNNSLRFPFISVETRNGADIIANIVSQTESGIEVNLINKSTDKATGVLYVRVMALNMAG